MNSHSLPSLYIYYLLSTGCVFSTVQMQRDALPTPEQLLYSKVVELGIHSECRNATDFTWWAVAEAGTKAFLQASIVSNGRYSERWNSSSTPTWITF